MKITTVVLLFLTPVFLFSTDQHGTSNTGEAFRELVASDYQQLSYFSKHLALYEITEERFQELLWNGALKALLFYESQYDLNSITANRSIRSKLRDNSHLGHYLSPPQKNNSVTTPMAFSALERFSGTWYGQWKDQRVEHNWLPVRPCKKELGYDYTLIGFQSCFTGDGMGWNYVVQKKNTTVILGFVYHLDEHGDISFQNPHYALLNMGQQLTWVSNDHLYFEFVCHNPNCGSKKHYVITGGKYEILNEGLELVSGFQAVYVPEKNLPHPAFRKIPLSHDTNVMYSSISNYWKGLLNGSKRVMDKAQQTVKVSKEKMPLVPFIAKFVKYLQ